MSSRQVAITGIGVVSAAGLTFESLWEAVCAGESKLNRIQAFDPSGFAAQIGGEVPAFKANQYVPKSYRKATKVMARDIELAVVAADAAVRDAGMTTPGTDAEAERTYPGQRMACHIGAGLIAADSNELTEAFIHARLEDGSFDLKQWGSEGINHLTPLWLLKYLPNMLACHVSIIHDTQGPSNTITCTEASAALSVGESRRVILRNASDAGFAGGGESKINLMGLQRQLFTGTLTTTQNDNPAGAVRPFDKQSDGTVIGEGSGILILEDLDAAAVRSARVYARVAGFAATTSPAPSSNGATPALDGRGIASAIRGALRQAQLSPDDIDLIVPMGMGHASFDQAELAGLQTIFAESLPKIPIFCTKPYIGNTFAASSAIDLAIAARALHERIIPAVINTTDPAGDLMAAARPATEADLKHVLVITTSLGGQNAAIVLSQH